MVTRRAKADKIFGGFLKDREIAERRVGATPQSRLKWLLEFSREDLALLSSGERGLRGECLRLLPRARLSHDKKLSKTTSWAHDAGSMDDDVLVELQEWTKGAFDTISAERRKPLDVPLPKSVSLWRTSDITAKKASFQYIKEFDHNDERPAIKDSIADVILDGGDYLRFCLECKKPFLAHRKKQYDTMSCSQKARDRRRGKQK